MKVSSPFDEYGRVQLYKKIYNAHKKRNGFVNANKPSPGMSERRKFIFSFHIGIWVVFNYSIT